MCSSFFQFTFDCLVWGFSVFTAFHCHRLEPWQYTQWYLFIFPELIFDWQTALHTLFYLTFFRSSTKCFIKVFFPSVFAWIICCGFCIFLARASPGTNCLLIWCVGKLCTIILKLNTASERQNKRYKYILFQIFFFGFVALVEIRRYAAPIMYSIRWKNFPPTKMNEKQRNRVNTQYHNFSFHFSERDFQSSIFLFLFCFDFVSLICSSRFFVWVQLLFIPFRAQCQYIKTYLSIENPFHHTK